MADKQMNIVIKAKDEASSSLKNVASAISGSFDKVKLAAGIAAGAVTAFGTLAVKNFADTGEKIANFSASTGLAADAASALKLAADGMGLSLDSVGTAVKKMQVNMSLLSGDAKQATEVLKPLHLKLADIKDLSPEEQFITLGNAIAKIEDPALRTTKAVELFGKSGTDLIPLFADGTASLDDFKAAAADAGVLFDDLALDKAVNLDNAMDSLNASVAGISQQLAIALAPAITTLISQVTPIVQKVSEWAAANPELASTITVVVAALGLLIASPVAAAIGGIVIAIGFAISKGDELAAAWEVLVLQIGIIWDNIVKTVIEAGMRVTETTMRMAGVPEEAIKLMTENSLRQLEELNQGINEKLTQIDEVNLRLWTKMKTDSQTAISEQKDIVESTMGKTKEAAEKKLNEMVAVHKTKYGEALVVTTEELAKIQGENLKLLSAMAADWASAGKSWVESLSGQINAGQNVVSSAINALKNLIPKTLTTTWTLVQQVITAGGGGGGKGKTSAKGNILQRGEASLVGEQGPETFIPDQRGTVIPNSKTPLGGGVTIIVTGNTVLSDDGAEQIGDMIFNKLRLQTKI